MGSSSLTKDWTQASCVGSTVLTTGPPGKSFAHSSCSVTLLTGSLGSLLPSTLLPGIFVSVSCLCGSGPSIAANTSVNTSWCSPHSWVCIWEDWPVSVSFLKSHTVLHSHQQKGNFLADLEPHIRYVVGCFSRAVFERCRVSSYVTFFFFWLQCTACKILVPWPGIKPGSTAVKVPSPNHWTAREVAVSFILTCIRSQLTSVSWPMQFGLAWKTVHEGPSFLLDCYWEVDVYWVILYVCVCRSG